MQDPEMVFWTTLPNFLLFATRGDDVVGIVAIQKKADKLAELNRLSVAMSLYEKLGFKLIGEFSGKISFFVPIPPSFHGIAVREYLINLEDFKLKFG